MVDHIFNVILAFFLEDFRIHLLEENTLIIEHLNLNDFKRLTKLFLVLQIEIKNLILINNLRRLKGKALVVDVKHFVSI